MNNIDKLAALLADISALTKDAEAIKDELKLEFKASGTKVFEGEMVKATVIPQDRTDIDRAGIIEALAVSEALIAKFTSMKSVLSVKVTSK